MTTELEPMDLATHDYLRALAEKLAATPKGGKDALLAEAERTLSRPRQWLYRQMGGLGLMAPRKTRADKGKSSVMQETLLAASAMTHVGTRANGKRITTLKAATEIAAAQGLGRVDEATGEIVAPHPSTVARALRQARLHPDQLRQAHPVTPQASKHPNWAWQIDVSRCVLFYLPGGKMAVMDADKFYKNKLENIIKAEPDLVNRWVVVDKASGAFHLRYLPGGESAENAIEFMVEAMTRREGEVMHGVPFVLGMDAGLAAKKLFSAWIERLGVKLVEHLKNPRANGSAESHQQVIERGFESRLRFHTKATDFSSLNREADLWRLHYCSRAKHSRHLKTRDSAWLTIRAGELRTAEPDLLRALVASEVATPTVDPALRIRFAPTRNRSSRTYDLRDMDGVLAKEKVQVRWNPYRLPEVEVGVSQLDGSIAWAWVAPLEETGLGYHEGDAVYGESFTDHKKTELEKNRERVEQYAYGVSSQAEVEQARKGKQVPLADVIDIMADVKAAPPPSYLPKRGEALEALGEAAPARKLEPFAAMQRLAAALGDGWGKEQYAWFTQRYPDGCTEAELEGALERLQAPVTERPRPVALRAVS